jgi:spore coat polysaccharide biosynthesis protein SpsF
MLIPFDDHELKTTYSYKYDVFEGPEEDVLSRYYLAMEEYDADLIVRLTGDCVWITSNVISKCLREALKRDTDYCSNILVRTFMEGLDVEVISRKALTYLNNNMSTPQEREHVTLGLINDLKRGHIQDFKIHTVISEYDMSEVKTSIDTPEDYEDACEKFALLRVKKQEALQLGSISN